MSVTTRATHPAPSPATAAPEIGPEALRGAAAGSVASAGVVAAAVLAAGGGVPAALALGAASAATGGPFFGALVAVARVLLRAERLP